MRAVPYLNFDGECRAAFEFYAELFGGTLELLDHNQTPMADQVPPEWGDRIMHARLVAGDVELMASDTPPGNDQGPGNLYVSLHIPDVAEAERIYHALSEGGTVSMPLQETFWAVRFGMFLDRFGIPWMINCDGGAGTGDAGSNPPTT